MQKRSLFTNKLLPYLLVAPQITITIVFFFWPASVAMYQSMESQNPFGLQSRFVWFDNFVDLFKSPNYLQSFWVTAVFSAAVAIFSLLIGLYLAVQADRVVRWGVVYNTLLIWPYAVASAVAGVLWLFLFNPTLGVLAYGLRQMGVDWNYLLDGNQALGLVTMIATWHRIPYNFLFFLAGLQSIPRGLVEAASIDGAGLFRRFWDIVFPLLMPTTFFLIVVDMVYAFFDTFAIIHQVTQGGPAGATNILVYKVYADGFLGMNIGSSAAQSVVLMVIVIGLTVIQFRYIERKVHY
ncbi:MAG TPA: sn-glycerol-3-phosphate ABC transporter permease UgpA [bacterium]|nr:sn-glycerol-3-phosphate ABC transporter permease UgpA [bacterium]